MRNKKILAAVLTPLAIGIAAGAAIVLCHNSFGTEAYCLSLINGEKNEMQSSINKLIDERKKLLSDNDQYDITINENGLKTSEIDSLIEEYKQYNSKLEELQQTYNEMNNQINTKKAYVEQLEKISNSVSGEKQTLKAGEYKCPSQLSAGRYIIEGTGYFYIYSIANTASLKENLSTIDTHSFVFDIREGETLKLDEDCSITSVENALNG